MTFKEAKIAQMRGIDWGSVNQAPRAQAKAVRVQVILDALAVTLKAGDQCANEAIMEAREEICAL